MFFSADETNFKYCLIFRDSAHIYICTVCYENSEQDENFTFTEDNTAISVFIPLQKNSEKINNL
jgi:hypothetical protein